MGNCCGARTDYLDIARDTSKETKEFIRLLNFDWNRGIASLSIEESKDNTESLTVEEMLMMKITNDKGEFVSPQVAHVAFTEFKKFMYLNKHFIKQEIKREEGLLKEGEVYMKKSSYVGLFAPPIIDSIWLSLISLDAPDGKYFWVKKGKQSG